MSETINNHSRRQEALKRMIAQLHAGKSVDEVKSQFAALLTEVDATEIAMLEQALIAEGMPAMEIKRLCDVHVAAFEEALNARARAESGGQPGAPVALPEAIIGELKAENVVAGGALDALEAVIRAGQWDQARARLAKLREHERHYLRKENVLFPYLEKHGFSGPSTVMWAIHDDIRAGWKQLEAALVGSPDAARVAAVFAPLAEAIRQMFYKEENILFPTALRLLTAQEWAAIAAGESAAVSTYYAGPEAAAPAPAESPGGMGGLIPLQVGALTAQQIALLLTHLPVEVTYVDENDEVRFYSATKERIFDRQPAIIGRSVQQCHPPTSVHRVQRVLDDFRSGRRDTAEFWIQMGGPESQGGKFIHIRYFAMRDEQGTYRGALEVVQDIGAIRKLEGERRLLAEGD